MGMLSGGGLLSMLGTLGGVASAALPVIRSVGTIADALSGFGGDSEADQRRALRAQQDLAMKQLQAQQGLAEKGAADQAALERQKIALDAVSAEDSRRAALRRAVARQRAAFGAQGLSGDDGSGEALLLGMFGESEQDKMDRERMDSLRNQAIDQDLADRQRINVLQRTQLRERQNMERALSGFNG